MRLFFAILLNERMRQRIAVVQETMKRMLAAHRVAWVREENLHLTLRFLGEQDEQGLHLAIEAGEAVAQQHPRLRFVLRGAGAFPNWRHARVLWVGTEEGTSQLQQLASSLETELRRRGFPPEDKPFRSHITLARLKEPPPPQVMQHLVQNLPQEPLGGVEVRSFVLMQSVLHPNGSQYTLLHEFPLR